MSRSLTELVEAALALHLESRAYLAEKLLETLDCEEDFAVNEPWLKEIRKRCQELDGGKVQAIPADIALAELRRSLVRNQSMSPGSLGGIG